MYGFRFTRWWLWRMPSSWYEIPGCTSQETDYVSATEPSRLMLCKIWDFHGGDYEEFRLRGIVFLRSVCRLLVTANVVANSPILVTHDDGALRSSEMSVLTATRHNIPKDGILNAHTCVFSTMLCCLTLKKEVANYSGFVLGYADPEVLGSIPGATRFSEYQWVWNGVHSASLR
jgi:hypothetical protein